MIVEMPTLLYGLFELTSLIVTATSNFRPAYSVEPASTQPPKGQRALQDENLRYQFAVSRTTLAAKV